MRLIFFVIYLSLYSTSLFAELIKPNPDIKPVDVIKIQLTSLMKNNEPYLIEYNVRMGDPECQTILPMLNTDLFEIFMSCCNETLIETQINWHNKKSLCVVLCSK